MAKNKISDYSNVAANNTDVGSINIAEGCAPSGINNAIRELMAQLKDFQTGADGDSFTVGGTLSVTGASNLTGVLTLTNPLAPASGGTGFASYTTGDILYASGSAVLSKLPIAASGNVLRSGSIPSWGKVNLTTDVTGALPAVNGGTGTTTSTGTGSLVLNTSPAFAGIPTVPTANVGTNTTQIASTAFVQAAVTASQSGLADTGVNGIVVRTSQGVTTARTLTNGTGITVSNGDGVAGNPIVSVSNLGINTSQLADNSVSTVKIQDSAITAAKIATSAVTDVKLASNSVTTAKIVDANVTEAKIADASVTSGKLASNSVTTVKILDANVTEAKLASNAVTTAKIADGAVTDAKLDGFTRSLGASGYQKLPSGLTMQWGFELIGGATTKSVTFPTAFSSAVYSIQLTARRDNNPGGVSDTPSVNALPTTSGFVASTPSAQLGFYWFAVGV